MPQSVTLYLEDPLLRSARAGAHNFIAHLVAVLEQAGYRVHFAATEEVASNDGLALTHMIPPPPGGLTFRRVYHYPFWAIEPSAERWAWDVAKEAYSPDLVPKTEADKFYERWQKRLFPTAKASRQNGFVYVPLQGRLLEHRSFQSCAPIDMLRATLNADPHRPVVAALHPKERYSDVEMEALTRLAHRSPMLTLRTGGMEDMLRDCDYIVTMNSAAAFNGMFFGKPSILFAKIDFHHVALHAMPENLSAFDEVTHHAPDYPRYLWWFWQERAINAGRPDVREKIRAALRRGGWSLPT
tara:strand:+ start:5314 stop:6207 length:894 start_codon:yes stop_codon:yes gene_type:complete